MKVLVTGGAGFIGSGLCEALLKQGYGVICLDNLITGNKDNISHLIRDSNFIFLEKDVTDSSLKLGDVSFIFHLASPASPKGYQEHPLNTLLANSKGTINMLELAKENNARLVFASTSEIY